MIWQLVGSQCLLCAKMWLKKINIKCLIQISAAKKIQTIFSMKTPKIVQVQFDDHTTDVIKERVLSSITTRYSCDHQYKPLTSENWSNFSISSSESSSQFFHLLKSTRSQLSCENKSVVSLVQTFETMEKKDNVAQDKMLLLTIQRRQCDVTITNPSRFLC